MQALFATIAKTFGCDDALSGLSKYVSCKESYRISTYLYAIVAGGYDHKEMIVEGKPPMRIYARRSLMAHVNFDEMFLVTQCGIDFYEELFGQKYPFNKYD